MDRTPHRDQRDIEDQKTPAREGEPPRPATEPAGAEGSQRNDKTATDPGTGAPQD